MDKCQGVLKEAMGHFRDDKIAPKVKRCLDIWREREVFEDKFIGELAATLDPGNPKSKEDEQEIVDSFQVRFPYVLDLETLKPYDINIQFHFSRSN